MAARLLAWLRRPWVLPVFAAASVMAVFVMARRTIVTEERPAEPAALEPAPAAPAPAPAAKDEALRGVLKPLPDRAEGSASAGVPRPRRTVHQKAVSVERRRAVEGVRGKADEGMPGELDRRQSERERKTAAGGAGRAAAAPVRVLNDEPLDAMDARAAARLEKGKETAKKTLPMRSYAEPPPAPMPAAAPPGAAQARPSAAALESAPEEAPAARDAENPAKGAGPLPYGELVRRAERAFSGERWADAAASYRELLRRFPGDRGAAAWKVRLARCDQALSR
jgi:hypothetical protein